MVDFERDRLISKLVKCLYLAKLFWWGRVLVGIRGLHVQKSYIIIFAFLKQFGKFL